MAERMADLSARYPGFLGMESVRDTEGVGITVSYWRDETAVRAEEIRQMHLGVEDQQTEALADEMLCQQDQRALTQIIGAWLERQSDHPDASLAGRHHFVDRMLDVLAVRCENCAVDGHLDIAGFREMHRRAEVFRQTGASEGEARLEISR